jgi:hypothetical protein
VSEVTCCSAGNYLAGTMKKHLADQFGFCPVLADLLRTCGVVGKSGKVFDNLAHSLRLIIWSICGTCISISNRSDHCR